MENIKDTRIDVMKDLINYLNYHTKMYDEGHPEISDQEWDDAYFQLANFEQTTGIYLENSPTQCVNYQVINELEKKEHNHKMLSLDKTKDTDVVKSFLGSKPYVAMAKMDGLTCSLRYINGKLVSAETRGNGLIGEDILHNALVVKNIPNKINYTEELIVDGEIICKYDDFENFSNEYANPRNFASGSIRLLDSAECAKRKLTFVAWEVIKGFNEFEFFSQKINELSKIGFTVVPNTYNTGDDYKLDIDLLKLICQGKQYPIDGIVFKFNNIEYGKSLGETGHHFKNAIAYKFYDEEYETTLLDIEWTMGRTGALTPVAVLEPIDIEGTEVSRASLHNISVMLDTLGHPYIGEKVWVFKANMIIPQISRAEIKPLTISTLMCRKCPICGGNTEIVQENNSQVLYCANPSCEGKLINRIEHYTDMKKGMAIKGISKATIEKLIDWGWLESYSDLYTLKDHRNEWIKKEGFGEKSVDNILNAIENSRECKLENFISAIGIPLIGLTNAKEICKHIDTFEEFIQLIEDCFDFEQWATFGPEKSYEILHFDYEEAINIYKNYLTIQKNNDIINVEKLKNLTFCVTGKVHIWKNRDELTAFIESLGGKVTSSVTKNTNYLINNDVNSTSAKNNKAKELGIEILSEENFKEKFLTD